MATATIAEGKTATLPTDSIDGKEVTKIVGTVKVDDLLSDHRWQRHVSKRAETIGQNWNDSLAQTIVVSRRKNGDLIVIDGQHRAAGARMAGVPELVAEIHEGLTAREEAELYDRLNTTRASITALDRFRARVFYRDPTAMSIKKAVEDRGGKIRESLWRGGGQQKEIAAIWALERVYIAGGEELLE